MNTYSLTDEGKTIHDLNVQKRLVELIEKDPDLDWRLDASRPLNIVYCGNHLRRGKKSTEPPLTNAYIAVTYVIDKNGGTTTIIKRKKEDLVVTAHIGTVLTVNEIISENK